MKSILCLTNCSVTAVVYLETVHSHVKIARWTRAALRHPSLSNLCMTEWHPSAFPLSTARTHVVLSMMLWVKKNI